MFVAGYVKAEDTVTVEITNDPKPGQQLIWHPEDSTFRWEFVKEDKTEYEVTIHVVYNSIPASEIAELVENQLRKHKDACKVDIKIKNPEDYILTVTDGTWTDLIDSSPITQLYTDGDTASD